MTARRDYQKLRIFAASPSDVATERARLATVVEDLKPLVDHIGVTLELLDWRQVPPGLGRPEQVILDQLKPDTWDVFVGILWYRFGTPPKGADSETGKEYLSGTEEEFRVAYRLWEKHQRPRVMFYRCKRNIPADDLDPEQYQRVKDFFAGFAPEAGHPGLCQTFESSESFERLVRRNLSDFLIEYSKQVKGRALSTQELEVLAPRPPDTLPRRIPFFGREDEKSQALRALSPEDRGWGLVIDGIGGIGKTALAVEVGHICKERDLFSAFILVTAKRERLELSEIRELTPAATTVDGFINECARALGQPGIAQLTGGERKQRALLEALRGQRALVILDNLETLKSAEQNAIGDLLRNLPQDCKAIVTSRRRAGEAAVTIRLEKMKWEEARALIADQVARGAKNLQALARAGEPRWKQLYDEAGGSPLALLWTIGLMRGRGLSFDRALGLLRDGSGESDLNRFIYREAQKTMDANERVVLHALSLFGSPATFEALVATADLHRRALEPVLERLQALSLVDVVEATGNTDSLEERYTLHPLTRRFAFADLARDAEAARETGIRFGRYWLHYVWRYGKDPESYDRLEGEWANVEAAGNWLWETAAVEGDMVGDKDAANMLVELREALEQYLWRRGRWDETIDLNSRAYKASRAVKDWRNAGWCAHNVAFIQLNRGRIEDANRWTDICAETWGRTESRKNQARVMWLQGLIAREGKDYGQAERLFQEALSIWRELDATENIARVLNSLGGLDQDRERYDSAEQFYRDALQLARKLDDKEGQGIYIVNLGLVAVEQKKWADAREDLEQALEFSREVGLVELTAGALGGLALVREAEGRVEQAFPLAREALAILKRLQHPDAAEASELVDRLRAKMDL